jgi:hypothetical protein
MALAHKRRDLVAQGNTACNFGTPLIVPHGEQGVWVAGYLREGSAAFRLVFEPNQADALSSGQAARLRGSATN